MAKTIIVSNRLPVKVKINQDDISYKQSEGGLATGLGSIYKHGNNLWIGWPGIATENKDHQTKISTYLGTENMKPVFLTEEEIEDFYEGFSNETLWPNFHYFNQYVHFDDDSWDAYKHANTKFAQAIIAEAAPDDTIWIHDYQLLLVPEILRKALPNASIGFFLHIPFPSYESFRVLPWRRELLYGMMGADFLGFHTYDDMRHFLSSANRLAGIGNSNGQMTAMGRKIMVDALPMGIDYDKYSSTAAHPETIKTEIKFRSSLGSEKIILSIDRLDYSKGMPKRLEAFEQFLMSNEHYHDKVSLLMVVVPSRDQVEQYKELKEEIDLLVGRINGTFSNMNWTPIHYFYRSFSIHSLSAMYRIADVAMVTPMRDGMNLVCKEFIASKLDKKGVLILSEMAGASKELSDAILVNPNDKNQVVQAILRALEMPEKEQEQKLDIMQKSLQRYNIHHWVDLFMERLKFIKSQQKSLETTIVDEKVIDQIRTDYQNKNSRILFLDYDGTLVGFHGDPLEAKPDNELKELLVSLTNDPKNRIVIISGRKHQTLQKWLSNFKVDIIAEHGVWRKEYLKEWQTSDLLDNNWKNELRPVLEGYVNRTPGSFIEEKDYSLVWHYRKVETGLGEIRTRELASHLKYLTADKSIQILEGDMVVEVKNSEINKGVAATEWLKKFKSAFVMAIGDDWTDEDTFSAIDENGHTVKVGSNSSIAKYRVSSHEDVRPLLRKLMA